MAQHTLDSQKYSKDVSITLIGMAGAGKTTVGEILAEMLDFAHLDTDRLIEAYFGSKLQDVYDSMGRRRFIQAEGDVVSRLAAHRTIISTGGSVVYSQQAVEHLKELGPVVYLHVDLETIKSRLSDIAGRGLAIDPDQTIEDLYRERLSLYESAADYIAKAEGIPPRTTAEDIIEQLGTDS